MIRYTVLLEKQDGSHIKRTVDAIDKDDLDSKCEDMHPGYSVSVIGELSL